MEFQKGETKTTDEEISVEETEKTSDDQFDELAKSTNECLFAVPSCDQLSDNVLAPA